MVFDASPFDEDADKRNYLQIGIAQRNSINIIGYQQYQNDSKAYSPSEGDSSYKIEETMDNWAYREILPSQRVGTSFYIIVISALALLFLIILPICVFYVK